MFFNNLVCSKHIADFVSLFLYVYFWGKKEDKTQSEFFCSVKHFLISSRKQVSWGSAVLFSANYF